MPSQYLYRQTICNEYLGVSKTIRAMSRNEFDWLVRAQLAKWAEQETRKRQAQQKNAERNAARQDAEHLKSQAAEDTAAAKERIEAFRAILTSGLGREPVLDWDELLDRRQFYPFSFNQPKPDRDAIRFGLLGPEPTMRPIRRPAIEKPNAFEILLPFLRTRREERNRTATARFNEDTTRAQAEYQRQQREYRSRENEVVHAYNAAAADYNRALSRGD